MCGIPGIWADVDYRAPMAHTRDDLPADRDAALANILESTQVPPSLIIDSGFGFSAVLLVREFWQFDEDEERQRAKALLDCYHFALRTHAHDAHVDTTSEIARV